MATSASQKHYLIVCKLSWHSLIPNRPWTSSSVLRPHFPVVVWELSNNEDRHNKKVQRTRQHLASWGCRSCARSMGNNISQYRFPFAGHALWVPALREFPGFSSVKPAACWQRRWELHRKKHNLPPTQINHVFFKSRGLSNIVWVSKISWQH